MVRHTPDTEIGGGRRDPAQRLGRFSSLTLLFSILDIMPPTLKVDLGRQICLQFLVEVWLLRWRVLFNDSGVLLSPDVASITEIE